MAATIQVVRKTGASPGAAADITAVNTRANADDTNSAASIANGIRVPQAPNTNYSYWISTRLNCTVTPVGTIDNLRWYTDGVNGFGSSITCKAAKASTGADAGYRQATGTQGVSGTQLTQANHSGLDAAPVDVFSFTVAAVLVLAGSITNPSTGQFGDHVVYQIGGDSTTPFGATPQETFTWAFDET